MSRQSPISGLSLIHICFGNELMADDCTSIGEFSVLLLIVILSALLVNSYCKKASVVWYIGGVGVGGTLLALLFSFYVIPFDITWFQYGLCVVLLFYLIFLSMHERMRNYFYIALFADVYKRQAMVVTGIRHFKH